MPPLSSPFGGSRAALLGVEMAFLRGNLAGARCGTAAAAQAKPRSAQRSNCICKKEKIDKKRERKWPPLLGITDVAVVLLPSRSGCRCSVLLLRWVLYRGWNIISNVRRSRHEAEQAPGGSGRGFSGLELHPESLCEDGGAAGGRMGWGRMDGQMDRQMDGRMDGQRDVQTLLTPAALPK